MTEQEWPDESGPADEDEDAGECRAASEADERWSRGDDMAWVVPLLTEASAAVHGNLSRPSLYAVIKRVPEWILREAGLLWATSPFDDDAPSVAAAIPPTPTAEGTP